MKKILFIHNLPIIGLLLALITSCGNKTQEASDTACDSIGYQFVTYQDSIKDSTKSTIIVRANVAMPNDATESGSNLKASFNKELLSITSDTLTAEDAISSYVKNIIDFYNTPAENISTDLQDETEKISLYEIDHNISPVYNHSNIFCVKKSSKLKKDGQTTIETNNYISFNTAKGVRIDITDIVKEEYSIDINNMLKDKLMAQEEVTNQSQLIDLGYFNIDNLSINNNFFFKEGKIVFAYEPYEIACLQVGEVCIALNLSDIKPYIKENSIIFQLAE